MERNYVTAHCQPMYTRSIIDEGLVPTEVCPTKMCRGVPTRGLLQFKFNLIFMFDANLIKFELFLTLITSLFETYGQNYNQTDKQKE